MILRNEEEILIKTMAATGLSGNCSTVYESAPQCYTNANPQWFGTPIKDNNG